jgi:hypothetical protein
MTSLRSTENLQLTMAGYIASEEFEAGNGGKRMTRRMI